MRRNIAFILLVLISFSLFSQEDINSYSLKEVIQLAKQNSIPAIRARHQYLLGYWRFRYFRSNYLPIVSLRTTPIDFNRTIAKRFDAEKNIDVYLPKQNIQSMASLSLSQRIGPTGGSIFLESDLGRLQNFGDSSITTPFTNYSVTPIRLGFRQPLFGFNELKWEKRLEPLAFDLAKRRYLSEIEQVSLQVLALFFEMADIQNEYELALSNTATSDTLLQIARERRDLGTLTQDDVLELELQLLGAQTARDKAKIELLRAQASLNVYLGLAPELPVRLRIPQNLTQIRIDPSMAARLAVENHPDIMQGDYNKLAADQEAEKTDKENRFNAEINASIGLNASNQTVSEALGNLSDQEMISVSLNIPLLDWGRREGRFKMAQSQRDLVYAEVKQSQVDFEQRVRIQVASYQMYFRQVENAHKGKHLASRRYEITRQRFLFGNVDLLKLTNALQAQNQAQRQYLQALQDYWTNYYTIRELTLFDFEKMQNLEIDKKDGSEIE